MITKYSEYINESIIEYLKGYSDEEIIKKFKLDKLNPNDLLIACADIEFYNGVKKAIELGANVNYENEKKRTAFDISIGKSNYQISKYLIENGAVIDVDNFSMIGLFNTICKGGDIPLFKKIIRITNHIPTMFDILNLRQNVNDEMWSFLTGIVKEVDNMYEEYMKKIVNE